MPAKKGVGLYNQERLFPAAGSSCQEEQDHPIRPGISQPFHLTAEDGELLTEERIFGYQFSLGTGKIGEHATQYGVGSGPHPLEQALAPATGIGVELTLERTEQT